MHPLRRALQKPRKKLSTDHNHDIHGLRLVVDSEEDCYLALKMVHRLWPEVPRKYMGYLTNPKFNKYQSLHIVVLGEHLGPLEVQIRKKTCIYKRNLFSLHIGGTTKSRRTSHVDVYKIAATMIDIPYQHPHSYKRVCFGNQPFPHQLCDDSIP